MPGLKERSIAGRVERHMTRRERRMGPVAGRGRGALEGLVRGVSAAFAAALLVGSTVAYVATNAVEDR